MNNKNMNNKNMNNKKIRVSIIGTAGRNGSYRKITNEIFQKMLDFSTKLVRDIAINNNIPIKNITLVSGGAALSDLNSSSLPRSDHIAIILYLNNIVSTLHLHLPCKYDMNLEKYDNSTYGNSSNTHHLNFSKHLSINSLLHIKSALEKGATFDISNGFFARNRKIAKCDYLVAFTFESSKNITTVIPGCVQKDIVLQGGTGNTWKIYTNIIKIHIPISCL